jgi:hypothetical protein
MMLLATILISACATEGQFSASRTFKSSPDSLGQCDDEGGTFVKLFYGNRRIRTAGVAHLQAGELFVIQLKPENDANNRKDIDFDALDVTISGKLCAPGQKPPESDCFLTAGPKSFDDTAPDNELVMCVHPDQPIGDYYYNIDIEDTGSLDPRAKVNN